MYEEDRAKEADREEETAQPDPDYKRLAEENWDRFLRARAELENYRKRVERDMAASIRRGKAEFILKILEVSDNLKRALSNTGSDAECLAEGVRIIERQLDKVLADEGVVPVETVGKPFDPLYHEAIAVYESDAVEAETVTDEIQKGYTYGDELLRAAKVRVARPVAGRPGDSEGE
ncbi:MAG: nucleotide exchange factor GrpE [Bacillota bacterium]